MNRNFHRQSQSVRLAAYLAELEREDGPIDLQTKEEVRLAWRDPHGSAARRSRT